MGQILISAAHKSSGKTIVSTGICACLAAQNRAVQTFKKGPDYIDPMWLSTATGRNCYNLDFWTQTNDEILHLFNQQSLNADISIIEANKGLYDGLDIDGSNSNAALAKLLGSSVVLVLDCRGTIRGIAPLLLGYQSFDPAVKIQGVILNFVGGARHEQKLRQVIETYTDIKLVGAIHRNQALHLEERHLGLIPSNETELANDFVANIKQVIEPQIDFDALEDIASALPEALDYSNQSKRNYDLKIAYALDAAFGFYYADDLDTFKQLGASLIPFDTLNDKQLPQADALFIGGGFPESNLSQLTTNTSLRQQIYNALDSGLPAYVECGGLMYLSKAIHSANNKAEMVGFIHADCYMTNKPQGRGYIQYKENSHSLWQTTDKTINAHEFHYSYLSDFNATEDYQFCFDVQRGQGIQNKQDGLRKKNTLACYAHQRHTQQNPWIEKFLKFIEKTKSNSTL